MIVVGYAAGAFGRVCLEQGIIEARLRDTELLVISAVSEVRGHRIADADEIADVEQRLNASGLKFRIQQPIGATPAEELLSAMDHPDAEMLVIGMRRRTQVGKLLLGSTSQYLLVSCHKPVLVVKPSGMHRSAAIAAEEPAEAPMQSGDAIEP
ncbi:universal stress protein [Gordonia caeni]|uniref:Universal stress protein n=1 Tax=Gordonia caeni TaxID=1007097 RepID=A0ABP7NIP6_9ACTN